MTIARSSAGTCRDWLLMDTFTFITRATFFWRSWTRKEQSSGSQASLIECLPPNYVSRPTRCPGLI